MTARGAPISPDDLARFEAALERLSTRQGWPERGFRLAFRLWCRVCAWHVRVRWEAPLPRGSERPPGAGAVVVVAPHRAWLEPFLLLATWPQDAARLVWLADSRTLTRSRWRRFLLPRIGVIPIAFGAGGPEAYAAAAARALDRGAALAVFPEKGPPSPPDRTRRISPGFAYLARRAGAPVVPVVVGGTHHIVRGSGFSLDVLAPLSPGSPDADPFRPAARAEAHDLTRAFEARVVDLLPRRTTEADAARPTRDRWPWLATLLR